MRISLYKNSYHFQDFIIAEVQQKAITRTPHNVHKSVREPNNLKKAIANTILQRSLLGFSFKYYIS